MSIVLVALQARACDYCCCCCSSCSLLLLVLHAGRRFVLAFTLLYPPPPPARPSSQALRQWLTLSQKKDIPYALLILMNMLHFEHNRLEQTAPTPAPTPLVDADIDVVAAQAAISSLDESIARESTLVSSAEVTDDEKLESLWREEQLVEEENEVRQATVKAEDIGEVIERIEDAISQEKEEIARAVEATAPSWEKERLSREREEKKGRDKAAKQQAKAAKERREQEKAAKKKQQEQAAHDQAAHQDFAAAADAAAVDIMAADAEVEMSREQIRDIAEAVDIMAADSAVAAERKEMEVLEAERAQHRPQIEAAKEGSSTVAMLDRRVSSMLAKLQDELETADSSIGKAFHSLDLDGDGMLTRDELVSSMESLHLSKRPDAAAFQACPFLPATCRATRMPHACQTLSRPAPPCMPCCTSLMTRAGRAASAHARRPFSTKLTSMPTVRSP